ncbi:unnamed protein product, partial [Closterium sp. NIES-53]
KLPRSSQHARHQRALPHQPITALHSTRPTTTPLPPLPRIHHSRPPTTAPIHSPTPVPLCTQQHRSTPHGGGA